MHAAVEPKRKFIADLCNRLGVRRMNAWSSS